MPDHPGNIRRLLSGTYARQEAWRIRMKSLADNWRRLDLDERRFLRQFLTAEEWQSPEALDLAARALIEARQTPWAWQLYLQHRRRQRLR